MNVLLIEKPINQLYKLELYKKSLYFVLFILVYFYHLTLRKTVATLYQHISVTLTTCFFSLVFSCYSQAVKCVQIAQRVDIYCLVSIPCIFNASFKFKPLVGFFLFCVFVLRCHYANVVLFVWILTHAAESSGQASPCRVYISKELNRTSENTNHCLCSESSKRVAARTQSCFNIHTVHISVQLISQ